MRLLKVFLFGALVFLVNTSQAATFTATGAGNWNLGATWGNPGNNTAGSGYPDAADIAVINGFNVIVSANQTVDSLFMDGSGVFFSVTVNSGVTFTVNNGIHLSVTSFGFAFINIAGGGTLTSNSNVTFGSLIGAAFCGISMANVAGVVNIGGDFILSPSGTFSGGGASPLSTTNFIGSTAQTMTAASGFTYHDVNITNSAGVTVGSDLTSTNLTGSLSVVSGILSNGGFTVGGSAAETFSVSAGATFELTDASGTMPTGFGTTTLPANSTVAYNRSGAQDVTGTTYSNLSIGGTGTKSLAGSTTISRELIVTSALNTNSNTCILQSTSSSSAAIGNSSGTITGNVTVQRHVAALAAVTTFGHWFMLASPLANSQSNIEDWNTEFDMTGFTGTEDPTSSFGSVYFYEESTAGTKDLGYTLPANTTDNLVNGRGYFAFLGSDSKGTMPKTIDVVGAPFMGSTSLSASFTNNAAGTEIGWNLLGNPYAAPVTWTNTARSGIAGASGGVGYVLDNTGDYDLMPSDRTILASGEAFWVQTSAAGSVAFEQVDKASADSDPFHSALAVPHPDFAHPLRIWLNVGARETKATVYLNENATENYDLDYDAQKLGNVYGLVDIATVADNRDLALNFLPETAGSGIEVPIRVSQPYPAGATNTYNISFTGVDYFHQHGYCLILEDRETGTFTSIDTDSSGYGVSMSDTTNAPRFFLHISQPLPGFSIDACFNEANGKLVAEPFGTGPFDYIWKNGSGAVVRNVTQVLGPDTLSGLSPGDYTVEVSNVGNGCGTIQTQFELTEVPEIVASFIGPDTLYLSQGANAQFINQSSGGSIYSWDFGDGNQSTQLHGVHTYQQTGIYTVTFAVVENHCQKESTKTVVVLDNPVSVEESSTESYLRYLSQDQGLIVEIGFEQAHRVSWEVVDAVGRTVIAREQTNGTDLRLPVDLSNQSAGIYLVMIDTGDRTITHKVVR